LKRKECIERRTLGKWFMITSFFIQTNRSSYEDYKHAHHRNGDRTPAVGISLLLELS
jgi:hypothetical protein